ncbi:hypothetical protein BP5796_12664 [Coleophoma crateriformis]|uniref:Zn(2)-C6 fungal-type domain-containing protein n=1 Tax=Coleophoma crateriformis TaxID=565419 RepID=A0A3D8Q726_9HELO|nr:hypothetical protein BP5796_12664 [Coleophoma crateriformis]
MGKTLRRSCAACAKAKHSCDLRTPKCSRCVKRSCACVYANEPLTSTSVPLGDVGHAFRASQISKSRSRPAVLLTGSGESVSPDPSDMSMFFEAHLFDPFDSYPATSLPRLRVQGLMRHFLSKIAFQYYPLDLNPASNPFVTSWWPLALTDPALFHVSLQTASLDDELHASKGFPHSELLMKDSVSLLRHKIQHESLAFQNATMNAVITLAAIEHGKGNLHLSKVHIDGVKRMVTVRGGLTKVRETSPLTARMVAWVSMLVTGSPQFDTQDDAGQGDGVYAIPQWQYSISMETKNPKLVDLDVLGLDPTIGNIIHRLRSVFDLFQTLETPVTLSTTDLHDLACFTLHRMLSLPPLIGQDSLATNTSECFRYGVSLYMFIMHGPTYYSHAHILYGLVLQLEYHLEPIFSLTNVDYSLLVWFLTMGAVASAGTSEIQWFCARAGEITIRLGLQCWDDVERHLKSVLWLETTTRSLFQQIWEDMATLDSSVYRTAPRPLTSSEARD